MDKLRCFDIVSEVINEASERFGSTPNSYYVDVLNQYCDIIDMISDKYNGESYIVEVDENTHEISIGLECWDFAADNSSHVFYKLIEHTTKWSFSVADTGNLLITYVFPSIWE
jgi:hypothetical protein